MDYSEYLPDDKKYTEWFSLDFVYKELKKNKDTPPEMLSEIRKSIDNAKTFYTQREAELYGLISAKRWDDFLDRAISVPELFPTIFRYMYKKLPPRAKYQLCIDAYTHRGDKVPAVRQAVRQALKYGKPELPPEISEAEFVTVYRAGGEPINKARCRISWTLNLDVAKFFYADYIHRHANYVYKAKIKPQHIIAYCTDRDEAEIMQYNKVFDVEDITEEVKSQP